MLLNECNAMHRAMHISFKIKPIKQGYNGKFSTDLSDIFN